MNSIYYISYRKHNYETNKANTLRPSKEKSSEMVPRFMSISTSKNEIWKLKDLLSVEIVVK